MAVKPTESQYVNDLVTYLKRVHAFVNKEHSRIRAEQREYRLRKFGPDTGFSVGDYVLLRKGNVGNAQSRRFIPENDSRLFQIMSAAGPVDESRAYVLQDPVTGSTAFDFAQPVSADRLVPVEILPLTRPLDDAVLTRIRSQGREGVVKATCVDGRVHVLWENASELEVVDLSRLPHEFVG